MYDTVENFGFINDKD